MLGLSLASEEKGIKLTNCKYSPTRFAFIVAFIITFLHLMPAYFHIKTAIGFVEIQGKCNITQASNAISNMIFQNKPWNEIKAATPPYFKMTILDQKGNFFVKEIQKYPVIQELIANLVEGKVVWRKVTIQKDDQTTYTIYLQKTLSYEDIISELIYLFLYNIISLFIILLLLILYIDRYHKSIYDKLDNFFKDAIHEIGTPMGVLQMNLDTLQNSITNSKALLRSQASLKSLISIYQSMEYSLKKEYVTYVKEDIDLSDFIENRLDFFAVFAELKNLSFDLHIQKGLHVEMNRIELERLIDNNLSNAIKYSLDESTIVVDLYMQDRGEIILRFQNHGKYIQNIDKIFERYYRDFNFSVKGSGIGLHIVRQICNKYDINVDVSSSKEGITTFIYKLHLAVLR